MLDAPDRIYFKHAQCRFVQCNQAVARRLNVESPEQVIGKTDFDFYPAAKAEEFHQDEQKLIKTGKPLLNKIEQLVKPGGEFWASVKTPLRGLDGKSPVWWGISRDITELKQAEEDLRQSRDELEKRVAERTAELSEKNAALQKTNRRARTGRRRAGQGAPAGDHRQSAWKASTPRTPPVGRPCPTPPIFRSISVARSQAEALGKNDFDLYPNLNSPKNSGRTTWKVFWSGEPVLKREEFFTDEHGRKRWLLTNKLPMRDAGGKIVGLVGIGSDITPV